MVKVTGWAMDSATATGLETVKDLAKDSVKVMDWDSAKAMATD